MSKLTVASAIVVAAATVAAGLSWGSEAAKSRTVWEGVYSEAQATRGAAVLIEQCAICHGESMRGGGGVPSAVGPEFMFNWNGKSVAELFAYLKMSMPPTAPGSLSDEKYADVMATLFKHNGFPASEAAEIPANPEALAGVLITPKDP